MAGPASGQPTVVATAEGQIGETPGSADKVEGARFESIRGQAGDLLFGGILVFGGPMPPPPAMQFVTDRIHGTPNPSQVGATASLFSNVFRVAPAAARSRNAADDGDFVAFSFAVDGAMANTQTVRIATFDETGSSLIDIPVATDVPTFPDPTLNETGVAVDDQGRATVVYTEFDMGSPKVEAVRLDSGSGSVLDPAFLIVDGRAGSDVALLDPSGERLVIPTTDFGSIKGKIVDFTGTSPVVLPEFPINSTVPAIAALNPAVAADPATGSFIATWEDVSATSGNPVDIRARRFDAMGNPIGNDFVVNTTTANAQGQPAVAVGPGGESVVAWAGDATVSQDELDVFAQVYDAMGNPIGGEIRVNTTTTDFQDRPDVRFLPEQDAQGRPQFAVVWRDATNADGSLPNGTGRSYKCFSIDPGNEVPIFEDGFESGDTTSWSSQQENP